jgi:hypothetical protein
MGSLRGRHTRLRVPGNDHTGYCHGQCISAGSVGVGTGSRQGQPLAFTVCLWLQQFLDCWGSGRWHTSLQPPVMADDAYDPSDGTAGYRPSRPDF